MNRKTTRILVASGLFAAMSAVSGAGFGASQDAEAQRLNDEAILTDYLTLNLEASISKLKKAIALCGASDCSASVLARVHRDLGVVYIAGMQKLDAGREELVKALRIDREIQLDKDLTTPEVEAAFAEAQDLVPAVTAAPEPPPPPPQSSDILHTAAAEQAVFTPLPIYVELPSGSKAKSVRVRYLPFGAGWKTLELAKLKDGYGGQIPCLDVGSTTGDLLYYIETISEDNRVLASSGSKESPYRVPIKNELTGEPPHLPGKPPPSQCQDASDCPPGFPGCSGGSDDAAADDADIAATKPVLNWITLGFQADFLLLPGTSGACTSSAPQGYECYFGGGVQRLVGGRAPGSADPDNDAFPTYAEPGQGEQGKGSISSGGFVPSTLRALVGYERVLAQNFTLGTRLGFAFNGAPKGAAPDAKDFLPFHAELNFGYWFGRTPFSNKGLRPFVRASGGLAQVDGKITASIVDNIDPDGAGPKPAAPAQTPQPQLEVWKKSGIAFAALGAGLMYAIKPNHGPLLELKAMMLFPDSGTALAAQVGYGIGF